MLKHLNIDEMVAIIAPWVDESKRKSVFLSIPEIAPLHGKVLKAYEAVISIPQTKATPTALASILEEETLVDARHDHLARAISLSLDARAELYLAGHPPDFARAARARDISRKLFPTGLAIVNASLLAESGNTARVARLVREEEPWMSDFLTEIPAGAPPHTLKDVVDAWIATGARLAELENARTELLAKEAATPEGVLSPQAARSFWLRVVSQVLSNLELSEAPAEYIEAIRRPVLRASERAERRYAGEKSAPDPMNDDTLPADG
ncbi:hypothetical protein [Polyangium jinanense]|uniref:Uncharacterized protein n=1 Tax=Polyangium jinanense TaxID=2829994 RepID=A0A9X4ATX4_9BACT|nr:hypothetical protein [Polyangium jinanense]MDC3959071.1 hypothetical protein [Polyangium jinanense]MDC3984006.1 hypothetical protein [Polyangium jinanense]